MDHDDAKENWTRHTNTYPNCTCPPWRYNPQHPKPTDEHCETHGTP